MPKSVVQPWVSELTLMQQSVLFAAIRGPDGIRKDHVAKKLARWLRRCVLIAAFDGIVYPVPYDPFDASWKSGSFTGPSCYQVTYREHLGHGDWVTCDAGSFYAHAPDPTTQLGEPTRYPSWQDAMKEVVRLYLKSCDELPHHYQLHFMHAAEIIGYEFDEVHYKIDQGPKSSVQAIAEWWRWCYEAIANDMHLNIETCEQMRRRLGDNESQWREAERGVHADV